MKAYAIDLAALGDVEPLWRDWLSDTARRMRVEGIEGLSAAKAATLDERLGNWRALLERFAEDRAPVYLRPDARVSAALRRLAAEARLGVFTESPAELAAVALAQLGAARRVEMVETGPGALERLFARLGADAVVVRTRDDLLGLR